MFKGRIQELGPRYCSSSEKERHQNFFEPWKKDDKQIIDSADICRDRIHEWFKTLKGNGLRDELSIMMVLYIVLNSALEAGGWKKALQSCAQKLKNEYTRSHSDIDSLVEKLSGKCISESWLTRIAYKWLKHLETARWLTDSNWYPVFAVPVAHHLFRLKGSIETFVNYLCHPSRRNMLPSIPLPSTETKRKGDAIRPQSKLAKGKRKRRGSKPNRKAKGTVSAEAAAVAAPARTDTYDSIRLYDGEHVDVGGWSNGTFIPKWVGEIVRILTEGWVFVKPIDPAGNGVEGWFLKQNLRPRRSNSSAEVDSNGGDNGCGHSHTDADPQTGVVHTVVQPVANVPTANVAAMRPSSPTSGFFAQSNPNPALEQTDSPLASTATATNPPTDLGEQPIINVSAACPPSPIFDDTAFNCSPISREPASPLACTLHRLFQEQNDQSFMSFGSESSV